MNKEEETYVDEDDKTIGKALREKLAQCLKEKEEYLMGWQRCQADAINLRQQEDAKRRDMMQFAAQDIIYSLIPVLDTFQHAFNGKDMNDSYVRGFNHIYAQLITILTEHGLTVIGEPGSPLDTAIHEAIGTIPVSAKEDDNKIMEIVENGYALHGKVIKPAKVRVGEYKNN